MKTRLAAICLILLLTALTACGSEQPALSNQATEQTQSSVQIEPTVTEETEQTELTTAPEPVIGSVDSYVGEFRREHLVYTDGVGNSYDNTYVIPELLLDSSDAAAVNAEIQSACLPYLEDSIEAMNQNCSAIALGISYEAWLNDHYLTLFVFVSSAWECHDYYVYTVDVLDGSLLDNNDLADLLGLTREALDGKILTTMEQAFHSYYSGAVDVEPMYTEQLERTISAENIADAQVYLDEDGNPMILCCIYSMAGADSYLQLIPLQ